MLTQKVIRNQRINSLRTSIKNMNPILRKNHDLVEDRMKKNYRIGLQGSDNCSHQFYHQLADISLFDRKYQVGDKIGEGSDGIVKKCIHKPTGKLYAVKTMMMDDQQIQFLKKNFISIKSLSHKRVIKYKALYLDLCKHTSHLVMEYLPHPNLLKVQPIANQKSLKVKMFRLFQVLEYIHSKNICHRDVKPQNIICVQNTDQIKLLDFGISTDLLVRDEKKKMLTITGTLFYRAPQMLQGGGYDEKIDLWSSGVTIYKMLTGSTPFESQFHGQTIKNIISGYLPRQDIKRFSKQVQDLISKLLQPNERRISASEALQHDWFNDIRFKTNIFGDQTSPLRKRLQSYDSQSSPLLFYVNQRIKQAKNTDDQTSPELKIMKRSSMRLK